MNKDTFLNITVGLLSAILIGGGAYMMMTGGMIKNTNADSQVATIETTNSNETDQKVNTQEVDSQKAVEKIKNNIIKNNMQDGLKIEIKKEGVGEAVKNGQTVSVHYTGMFTNGKVFDSSLSRGVPLEFKLGSGMVIKGWDKGVLGMKKGEKRTLTISPELAYGEQGAGNVIPPNSTLVFDVELVDFK